MYSYAYVHVSKNVFKKEVAMDCSKESGISMQPARNISSTITHHAASTGYQMC